MTVTITRADRAQLLLLAKGRPVPDRIVRMAGGDRRRARELAALYGHLAAKPCPDLPLLPRTCKSSQAAAR